jgi:quinohemoprotein ethanol dehydrogenase
VDLTVKGRLQKVLMQANKDGFYYVLDRGTGKFLSGQPFVKVTWAKGLNEETGRPIVNPEARYGTEAVTISPGPGGGHNWAPMSFNPATGLVYIPSSVSSSMSFSIDPEFTYTPGKSNTGLKRNGLPQGQAAAPDLAGGAAATAGNVSRPAPPSPPGIGPEPPQGQRGMLIAWDPTMQKEQWRAPGGGGIGGGTVSTAGNLVFQVINDGRLVVYTADKGEKLLDVQTGLRGGMGPPITYQLDGKQYVTLMGGTGVVQARDGGPLAANAAGPGGAPATPPAMPKLLTFALDGKAPLPAAE